MIAAFFISVEIGFQEIWEKEDSQNGKHDEKLDQDDQPEAFANGHVPEAVVIEVKYPLEDVPLHSHIFSVSGIEVK